MRRLLYPAIKENCKRVDGEALSYLVNKCLGNYKMIIANKNERLMILWV